MIDGLIHALVWLNDAANAVARWMSAPMGAMPGWLSATLIGVVTGVLMLILFKYTSNQRAIKRARDEVSASLLAIKLFNDSPTVALRAQPRILSGVARLLLLTAVPVAIMALPMILLLGQLSLWYEQRPLHVGEEAVVTLSIDGPADAPLPEIVLLPCPEVEVLVGPIRSLSNRQVCWNIGGKETGTGHLVFHVGNRVVDKELVIGDGFERVSARRPGWGVKDVLMYPAEQPLPSGSVVQSIAIDYPQRSSWTSGTGAWVIYWFAVSFLVALCFRRLLNVHI